MPNIAVRTASGGRNHVTAKAQYAQLVAGFSPVAIESKVEHDRALAAVADLLDKDNRSPAETSLLKLLAVLIEDFEQKRYSMGDASPLDALKELMRAREMQAKDLWPVFGSKGITSEVLNGKRGISNEMARKLGDLFRVSPDVFIWVHPSQAAIDAVRAKDRKIAEGLSRVVAPGYRIETALTKWGPVMRVWQDDIPAASGFVRVKGAGSDAASIVRGVVKTLSEDFPESLIKPVRA